ncbi:MAG: 16S rRNA (uracil1498-N3)-methyltransferase [Candidatus Omnitrophota bacterium]|jgi:16S rRNA (uracil1498-N3)-methyltransferase
MVQFLSKISFQSDLAEITGLEAKHVKSAFRMKVGDSIRVFDGEGQVAKGQVSNMQKDMIQVTAIKPISMPVSPLQVDLAQSLLPHDRMDEIVLKATELGVARIIPCLTKRSIVKLDKQKFDSKIERWKKIVLAGCKQCDRAILPKVEPIHSVPDLIKTFDAYDSILYAHPTPDNARELPKLKNKGKCLILIGPEGGFSEGEVDIFKQASAHGISLGPTILRSETAAQYLLSAFRYEYGIH